MNHPRPSLLTIGMYISGLIGAVSLIALVSAAANVGQFTMEGEPATGSEFLSRFGVLFAANGLLLLLIAWSIAHDRVWSRHLMLLFWILGGAWATGQAIADLRDRGVVPMELGWLAALAIAWWYLFRSGEAMHYYGRREQGPTSSCRI